ncbi:MAG: hypothetical protein FD145_1421 [Candidatus Saganbacteria bacterium]|uniref:Uncharacterized protein n=1 Tax=Candidatus Saganbacteria bacterium TaxID=2575572 RepID=A0A833KZX6_UNCSA|nr:MAG: hypothetical protein FD145_1421 [Candidatus Saganbacteria bacterium]
MLWKILMIVLILFQSISFAEIGSLNAINNAIGIGYIKAGTSEVGSISWNPDFKLGAWALGVNCNFPLGNNKPEGYESIVFRYAEYNDGQKGLRYGVLDNLTWGKGLLMKNYSSRTAGSIIQSNEQTALKGFINADRIGVQALSTWSHIFALRFTEKINPMFTLGQSFITDSDGTSVKQTNGTVLTSPSVTGYAIDASVPLPLNFEGYAEAAQLVNHGSGITFGLNWAMDILVFSAALDAGYRSIDNKFVPGYFNTDYETNPISLTSYEATGKSKDGYIAELKLLAANLLKFNALYECYNGSNASLNADAETEYDKIKTTLYYKQPNFQDFRSLSFEQGAILGGSVGYKVNPNTMLVTNFKKAYDPVLGRVVETQFYEVKIIF